MKKKKTLGMISLGCDKNRVDSEKFLGSIFKDYEITPDISQAQIIVINSCAFLESARKEAIDTAIECDGYRTSGRLEKLIMTGCMPQRFIGEMFDSLTEVDGFLGILDYDIFNRTVEECYKGKRVNNVCKSGNEVSQGRILTTPAHFAYLKISDGCDNKCTYCLIPSIRGKYRSTPIEQLVHEAEVLGDTAELILVAQDVTRYGADLYGKPRLTELIEKLSALDNIGSLRLLYCYPDIIDNELIDEFISNDKLLKYIDIPLQHASDGVLKRMNRRGSYESYINLIRRLKEKIKGVALRSTFITGFPGESEEDFEILKKFLCEAQLDNAGFFAYSREEGTPAYKLPQQIDERTKKKRVKELYALQKKISAAHLSKLKGEVVNVICDGIDYDKQCFVGRTYFQAPDIDGKVYFTSEEVVNQGECYKVKVTRTNSYDLFGKTVAH